jgi:hypothetical protein
MSATLADVKRGYTCSVDQYDVYEWGGYYVYYQPAPTYVALDLIVVDATACYSFAYIMQVLIGKNDKSCISAKRVGGTNILTYQGGVFYINGGDCGYILNDADFQASDWQLSGSCSGSLPVISASGALNKSVFRQKWTTSGAGIDKQNVVTGTLIDGMRWQKAVTISDKKSTGDTRGNFCVGTILCEKGRGFIKTNFRQWNSSVPIKFWLGAGFPSDLADGGHGTFAYIVDGKKWTYDPTDLEQSTSTAIADPTAPSTANGTYTKALNQQYISYIVYVPAGNAGAQWSLDIALTKNA